MIRIGIDIGGTFTDFVVWRDGHMAGRKVSTFKLPSTPPDFHTAVIAGLEQLVAQAVIGRNDDIIVVHGTTVSTNTVIERTGAKLGLFVTEGFQDLLNIQRLRLDKPIELFNGRAVPLIPRERVIPIRERLDAFGRVRHKLDTRGIAAAGKKLIREGVEHAVVCFLHSYRNPAHEKEAVVLLRRHCPKLSVTASSEIWPQQAEYERSIVAILNAYVHKKIDFYIAEIEAHLRRSFKNARVYITRSNGGVMSAREARSVPVHTLLSGPASGVSAGVFTAKARSEPALLTMDMGGTSTDLSLVLGEQPLVSTRAAVGDFPLFMPVTGIEAIGAGGGSIAAMDGPVLTVGPQSAGALPGPACYGRGGKLPTLTDAYLLCGYIDPKMFLGGRMPLSPELAARAMEPIGRAIGADIPAVAEACVGVATSNMVAKVLPYLARMGVDPKDVTLLAYGGAGPIHASLLADEIGIERVLVPATPSVFCAFGGIVAPFMHDVNSTVHGVELTRSALIRVFKELTQRAKRWLDEQIDGAQLLSREIQLFVEARYVGQSFNVPLRVPDEVAFNGDLAAIYTLFHEEHRRLYAHADVHAKVEVIEARARIIGAMTSPDSDIEVDRGERLKEIQGTRRALFDGTWHDAKVMTLQDFAKGRAEGPAVVECGDTSILVPPRYRATSQDGSFVELRRTA